MLSRIFWIGLAAFALIAGMVVQSRSGIFSWSGHDADVERAIEADVERKVEAEIDRALDGGATRIDVVGSNGREVAVPPEAKRALADSVRRLIQAEARLIGARIGDPSPGEVEAAEAVRDEARADVDRLKAAIESHDEASATERDALREEIRREARQDVRDTVREAVRN